MFINGVYNDAEQKMLDDFQRRAADMCGWAGEAAGKSAFHIPLNLPQADASMFRIIARNNDPKNPLFSDREYANQSCWGGLIAPPLFLLNAAQWNQLEPHFNEQVGTVLSCESGADYRWLEPVREGDRLRIYCNKPILCDETPSGPQAERVLAVYSANHYYRCDGAKLGSITHCEKWRYTAPNVAVENVFLPGCERIRRTDVRPTGSWVYTPEQAETIQDFYEAEPRQGDRRLFWEDVHPGDELPAALLGPVTEWDMISAVGPSAEKTLTMMEMRQHYTDRVVLDSDGIPHHRDEIYLSKTVPLTLGSYSSSLPEQSIASLMLRMVGNWMGDEGFVCHFGWRRLTNTALGDTVIGRGRVVRRYTDENGHALIDLDLALENYRGFIADVGRATVRLPSHGGGNSEQVISRSEAISAGDTIRMRAGANWEFGPTHPLQGETGRLVCLVSDMDGYGMAVFDHDHTGLDPRIAKGVRLDMFEKV